MWKIGDLTFESNVVLAPMAGITSLSYREFYKPFGVAYSVSEMVSDCGLVHGNHKTFEYLKTSKVDRPVAIQLFGHDINDTIKAIDIMEKEGVEYDILDINLGCPVKKVISTGAGSAWLKKPEELGEYMKKVVEHSKKPVTAKIRLGIDEKHINVKEVVSILIESGVKAIGIHARTTKQLYAGKPLWNEIKGLRNEMSVPLIVSGDIFTLEDAINAVNITGADAVMVARGGMGNPYLVTQISHYFQTFEKLPNSSKDDNIKYCRELAKAIIAEKGPISGPSVLRQIAPFFFTSFPNAKKIRSKISSTITSYEDLNNILIDIEKGNI